MWECDAIQTLLSGVYSFEDKYLVYSVYDHKDAGSYKQCSKITKEDHMKVEDLFHELIDFEVRDFGEG